MTQSNLQIVREALESDYEWNWLDDEEHGHSMVAHREKVKAAIAALDAIDTEGLEEALSKGQILPSDWKIITEAAKTLLELKGAG